jgi:predicted RND superfamily exporter protein
MYGNSIIAENTLGARDKAEISKNFDQYTVLVLLVPRGDIAKEQGLSEALEKLDYVSSVVSFANQVGTVIPPEFLDDDVTSQFYSENYARIVVYTDTSEEGAVAFATVEKIMDTARSYYNDEVWSVGQSANLYDMKTVVQKDNLMVTLLAVIGIFFILLLMFRSWTLPLILLLTIESAIWINLAIPYFTGTAINFIGFLVLSTVQLVATVDYAILLTNHYRRNRKTLPPKEAMHLSMGTAFRSILVSVAILSAAGFTLYATSTNPAISDIGLLLGRGALLSFAMVVCFLPGMLRLCDRGIARTTWRSGFLFNNDKSDNPEITSKKNYEKKTRSI